MSNRRKQQFMQDLLLVPYDHAAVTADTTVKLLKASRAMRIDKVRYVNPTGLAADAANFFNLKLLNGATVMANWSTETGQEGTLTADTFVEFTLSATDSELVLAVDDELAFFMDETGTASLPAGRLQIEGRYL